jgi:hypothetical protein
MAVLAYILFKVNSGTEREFVKNLLASTRLFRQT